ncbi:type II toxin-antitoxin system RelE/ParE family toxin [Jiella sp. MQZ9-1]|uniref:Type II toxin-antitoxin system RelE/ParE family toxin n=1 Tax=Jiella flava TaxID=2816857 RepID=A0A939G0I6_9HYPH|nr:type II toxin-antitoxin system RelE/ParE family toxin [Jiella flava]MBO0662819.1 type II toxin-antitoxin system RelE/ParE family toxin [Jiella flava]MCD2471420.1 type II toxin-antitoxin system RelE/ParE family toxin [Jiella flava]
MSPIIRSALFKRQLIEITSGYRVRAGSKIALQFVDQIEAGVRFIVAKPLACKVYARVEGREFRKWGLQDFPVSIFFRLEGEDAIILEALYAHRMNIAARLPKDVE